MKSNLLWPYIASLALHASLFAAVSWLQVNAATAPAGTAYVEIAFLESTKGKSDLAAAEDARVASRRVTHREGERTRDARPTKLASTPSKGPDGEGEAPAEPPNAAETTSASAKTPKRDLRRAEEPDPNGPRRAAPAQYHAQANSLDAAHPRDLAEGRQAPPSHSVGNTGDQALSRRVLSENGRSVVHIVEPVYPRSARRAGHEGRVVVVAVVLPSGRVARANVLESSGHVELDEAACKAARRSRFEPATRAGGATLASKKLVFRFALEELP